MKAEKTVQFIAAIIALMFFYAVAVKLSDYEQAYWNMHNQVFSEQIAVILTWLIPTIECLLIMLLLYKPFMVKGLWGALTMLSAFSLYIVLAMHHLFDRTPCSCGGILGSQSSYYDQLWFNIAFILLALAGLIITHTRANSQEKARHIMGQHQT